MKLKNLFLSLPRAVGIVLFLFSCLVIAIFLYHYQAEEYQQEQQTPKPDTMSIINKFCDKNFGDEWVIDSASIYNDKIAFFVIQTESAILDVSVQPENRAIIVENIRGLSTLKKRVHRF